MATRPQDYVSDRGRLTNTVEGFHGIAVMYRSKRTDLHHAHYVCKTNMAICHKVNTSQNLGPVWKVFVLVSMGVDIPVAGVNSILKAQAEWEKSCVERSTKEKIHKRSDFAL